MLLCFLSTYYFLFFRGPILASDETILRIAQNPGVSAASGLLEYVELHDRQLIPSGYKAVTTIDGKVSATNPYWFVAIGDKFMLVMTEPGEAGKRLVGPIGGITGKADREAYDAILKQHPEAKDRLLPIMLNAAAAFTVAGYVGFGLFLPVVLLCTWNIARGLAGLTGIVRHPIGRSLARLGDAHEIADQIDEDLASGEPKPIGKATVTGPWLLRPTVFGLIAVRITDVVWAYPLKVTGDHVAALCLRGGKMVGVPLKGDQVQTLLREIFARVPWALRGFDTECAKLWRKRPGDIIDQVDAARKKQRASPSPPR